VELVHLDGFITKKKPIYRVAQEMYTLFTHQYKGAVCIHFFGPLCIRAEYLLQKDLHCICVPCVNFVCRKPQTYILTQIMGEMYFNNFMICQGTFTMKKLLSLSGL
jgi:hypothetical protein